MRKGECGDGKKETDWRSIGGKEGKRGRRVVKGWRRDDRRGGEGRRKRKERGGKGGDRRRGRGQKV